MASGNLSGGHPAQNQNSRNPAAYIKNSKINVLINWILDLYEKHITKGPLNHNILLTIIILNLFGIIMIYSSSFSIAPSMNLSENYFMKNQATYFVAGAAAMLVTARIDYHTWIRLGSVGIYLSIILILLLMTPLGNSALGATRWLKIGPIRVQVAEPIKLFIINYLAMFCAGYGATTFKNRMILCGVCGSIVVLLAVISDNVSTALIITAIFGVTLFVTDRKKQWKLVYGAIFGLGLLVIAAYIFYNVVFIEPSSAENFRITRIRAWLYPEEFSDSKSIQAMQALYAIGSGGFWGKGLGQSLIKFKLAEPYNDYIFASVCEELGIFGACLLMFLFGYLLYQLYKVLKSAEDVEGKVFTLGVMTQVEVQIILNLMVVTNYLPTTGVTLPFISYGGSSLCFLLVEFGIILNIDASSKEKRYLRLAKMQVDKENHFRSHY